MSGNLDLSGGTIGQSGEQLTGTAERLTSEIASFGGRLAGFENAFGGDDLGSAMQMVYDAISTAAMECFDDNAAVLAETGGKLVEMGAEYAGVEQSNEGLFTDLLGRLGQ
ncbi:hypothetical protein FHS29_000387 [Saccharothrix tamanrassetensis]|uniref:Excreted virulence factor EspC (Type VII ESX diderm) n=1 Tax=Saccharothrix tamanrassetensis TaxID=1051531 RepID=A0A841CCB3_9PSEU|nr:hypothetical protein [Saccharothrix tamanrassetensis]MBB5953817.1 hypothetical protein [Saccharothrix tamanrassetensis]